MLMLWRSCPTSPAACQVVPLVSCLRSRSTTSLQPSFAEVIGDGAADDAAADDHDPSALGKIGHGFRLACGRCRDRKRARQGRVARRRLALEQDVEDAAGRGERRFDAGEREALAHPMTVSARGRHADAAAAGEHRLAAARIGVSGVDFGIDDLERPLGARPESPPCRRSHLFSRRRSAACPPPSW